VCVKLNLAVINYERLNHEFQHNCRQGRSHHFRSEGDRMSSVIPVGVFFLQTFVDRFLLYWLNILFIFKAIK